MTTWKRVNGKFWNGGAMEVFEESVIECNWSSESFIHDMKLKKTQIKNTLKNKLRRLCKKDWVGFGKNWVGFGKTFKQLQKICEQWKYLKTSTYQKFIKIL